MADSAFQQVIDDAGDHHLVAIELVEMDKGLVCADNLLEVECYIDVMRKGSVLIECLVEFHQLFLARIGSTAFRSVQFDDLGTEDAASEIASIGHEIDCDLSFSGCVQQRVANDRSRRGTQFVERLANLMEVLVLEKFVDRHVVVAPGEMSSSSRFLACTCRSRDGIHCDVVGKQSCLCQWEQTQLDTGGKTSGVGQMLALTDGIPVGLGQTIDKVVSSLDAEVLRHVDDLDTGRDVVFAKVGFAFAMTEAEEHHIDLVERCLVGERQVGIAIESLMNSSYRIACIRLGIGKDNLYLGMMDEQADEFASRVTCCA